MTAPDQAPRRPDPRQQPEPQERSSWWLALLAVPVLCCAGPALLAAVGVGSLGAVFAAGTGQVVLAVSLALVVLTTVIVLIARARRRSAIRGASRN